MQTICKFLGLASGLLGVAVIVKCGTAPWQVRKGQAICTGRNSRFSVNKVLALPGRGLGRDQNRPGHETSGGGEGASRERMASALFTAAE